MRVLTKSAGMALALALLVAGIGLSAISTPTAHAYPPAGRAAPTNVRADYVTTTSIRIRWEHASSAPVHHFSIYTDAGRAGHHLWLSGASRFYAFTGLSPDRTYHFEVLACYPNMPGSTSTFSCYPAPIVNVTTRPVTTLPGCPPTAHDCRP
jgi:hypothetical protein